MINLIGLHYIFFLLVYLLQSDEQMDFCCLQFVQSQKKKENAEKSDHVGN